MPTRNKHRPTVSVSLNAIAIASAVVAVASLTTLILVASIKGADTLSTVALALAILAFVVQIIVYIVQSSESLAQAHRSQNLHTETLALLTELRERTTDTHQTMTTMNDRLLEAVLGKTQLQGGIADTAMFNIVSRNINDSVTEANSAGHDESPTDGRAVPPPNQPTQSISRAEIAEDIGADFPAPLPPTEAAQIHEYLETWPSATASPEVLSQLTTMSKVDVEQLVRFAVDLHRYTRHTARLGPGIRPTDRDGLQARGLIEKIPGWKLWRLSPKGMELGRVFTAPLDRVEPGELASIRERELINLERKNRLPMNREELPPA